MKTFTKEEFESLKQEWVGLDDEYDNLFKDFLDNPGVKAPEDLEKFMTMQKRLYAIEDELYKIAEGNAIIEE